MKVCVWREGERFWSGPGKPSCTRNPSRHAQMVLQTRGTPAYGFLFYAKERLPWRAPAGCLHTANRAVVTCLLHWISAPSTTG